MDDNDVQLLDSANELTCQICNVSLTHVRLSARQAHYEQHLSGETSKQPMWRSPKVIDLSSDEDSKGKRSPKKSTKAKAKAPAPPPPPTSKQNIFWHRSKQSPPPANFTPGLITILKDALLASHEKGQTVRAALCYAGMVHVATEWWDNLWGCGYRNFLMACTALIDQQVQPLYFPALDEPTPPGVRNLQHWIENAWAAGYDQEGAKDLKHKLVGTMKWIGTAELYVAFLFRGIPSRLVDFPNVSSGAEAVVQWIEKYFSSALPSGAHSMRTKVKRTVDEVLRGASPVTITDRMPIILQHEGHSRTIVGYEKLKDGSVNLLCFDPARKVPSAIREAALATQAPTSAPVSNSRRHAVSPSKILNHMFHPLHHKRMEADPSSPGKKRRAEDRGEASNSKRVRGGLVPHTDADDVIVIDDDDELTRKTSEKAKAIKQLDYSKVLSAFRLRPKKIGKNDRYQILYFTLEDILTEEERWARRVVTSDVVQ